MTTPRPEHSSSPLPTTARQISSQKLTTSEPKPTRTETSSQHHPSPSASNKPVNKFRLEERRYKLYKGKNKRRKITDFSKVIHLTKDYKGSRAILVESNSLSTSTTSTSTSTTSTSTCASPQIWKITHLQGLYVIKHGLDVKQQAYWALKAVKEFSNCLHTNLSNLHGPQPNHWEQAVKNGSVGKESGFFRLRWASLGYHYDWTNRLYHRNAKSDFPPELAKMAGDLAKKVGLEVKSEAAIVNFYPFDGAMGGHVDDAEMALCYPIVSVSLGCKAVFLIGGRSKETEPTAIFVESGDVVIMGGHSRVCYHGVPRIIQKSCPKDLLDMMKASGSMESKLLGSFLQTSRINMNIRQVLDEKQNFDAIQKPPYPRPVHQPNRNTSKTPALTSCTTPTQLLKPTSRKIHKEKA